MFKHSILVLIIALFTSIGFAEELSQSEVLSLEESLKLAYRENPYLMEARKEKEAEQGRVSQKKALPNPEAEFSIGGFRNKEDGSRKGNLDSYSIIQPLGSLSERLMSFSNAKDEVRIADSRITAVWAEVRSKIITLYTRVIAQEKTLEFSRENLNSTRQLFVGVESRFHSGSALQNELTRARIEVLQSENDVLTQEKELKSLKGELNLNLGRQPEDPLILSDFLSEEKLNTHYEGLVEKAFELRPDLKAEEARLRIHKKNLSTVYSKVLFPNMAVGFERTMEDFENDSAVILQFSYPLWSYGGEIKEAKAEYGKQKVKVETLKREAHLDVYQSFLDAELAERQVTIQKNALDESHDLLRQTSIQYETGEMPFITFLDNLRTIKETRLHYLNALANYQEKVAVLDMAVGNVSLPEGVE